MGIDACIGFKLKNGVELSNELKTVLLKLSNLNDNDFATVDTDKDNPGYYELTSLHRFYGIGYERGDWETLCIILTLLMALDDVESVYYYGDNENPIIMSWKKLVQITEHYALFGHEPYFK